MSRIGLIALFILTTIFTNAQEIPVQFALTDTAGIERELLAFERTR